MSKWIISNNLLLLKSDNSLIYLSASDIFSFNQTKNPLTVGLPANTLSPAEALPDIRFPEKIHAIGSILFSFDQNKQTINLSIQIKRLGKKYTVANCDDIVPDMFPDHIICGKSWTYISNMSDINNLLKDLSISDDEITLKQYLSLKYQSPSHDIDVVDKAESYLSNHPLSQDPSKPVLLKAKLYPYQEIGYRWLRFMTDEGCGCILGDEMGLGKTLQIIALIAARCQKVRKPSLVIAPVSLLENWKREFAKFTENIRVHVSYQHNRISYYKDVKKYDVVITAYSTAVSDYAMISMADWDLIVLDEAQNIKNPEALRTKTIKKFKSNGRIAVTGTPFENHMTDLWSLTDFIFPGLLGSLNKFKQDFPDDTEGAKKIEPILTPLLIRRKVRDVGNDLPERTDIPEALIMDENEAANYESIRQQLINELGNKRATLPLLQKLRMYCTHPALLTGDLPANPEKSSQKYQRLLDILNESLLYQRKIIIFTSYNHMFDILEADIHSRFQVPTFTINGSTKVEERQNIIDQFTSVNGPSVILLNPKAAGTGLNITSANIVIHYNLEWNPALEDQASARAYRRGQKNRVFIYRLFYQNTVEEIINERIEQKRLMAKTAVIGTTGQTSNKEDIARALMLSPQNGDFRI